MKLYSTLLRAMGRYERGKLLTLAEEFSEKVQLHIITFLFLLSSIVLPQMVKPHCGLKDAAARLDIHMY